MNRTVKKVVAAALVCACVAGAKPSEASVLSKVAASAAAAVTAVTFPAAVASAAMYITVGSTVYDVYDTFIKKKN